MRASLFSCLIVATLAGCSDLALSFRQNEVASVQRSGETHIALLAVEPWSQVVDAISPDFAITPATALTEALPRVSALEEKLLDVFAAKLGLGLPTESLASTQTTDLAEGTVTGQRTLTEESGALPGSDLLPALGDRSARTLSGLKEETREATLTRSDPLLRYQAANAIYQYVQVLQRLIRSTPSYDNFVPYLVTFQITSVPYTRHQPYDVYVSLSFYPKLLDPGANKRAHYPLLPIVVPVMITDNVEAQSVSRAAELIRQFSLAAQGTIGGVAAALGINTLSDRSAAVFGTDLTSTFTVGRTAQNGLTAVLGAPRNPVSDYAMVRRTHNVSLLIMVPRDIAEAEAQFLNVPGGEGRDAARRDGGPATVKAQPLKPEHCEHPSTQKMCLERRLQVFFHTELRRPDEVGPPLSTQAHGDPGSVDRVLTLMKELGLERPGISGSKTCGAKSFDEFIRNNIRLVPMADYETFTKRLTGCDPEYLPVEALYHVFIDAYGNSPGFRTTTLVLPKIEAETGEMRIAGRTSRANHTGSVGAFDDGVGRMSVEVAGVTGKLAPGTIATLELRRQDGVYVPFNATEMRVDKGRLVAMFPSAKALGVANVRPSGSRLILRRPTTSAAGPGWHEDRFTRVVYHVRAAAKPSAAAGAKSAAAQMTVNVAPDGTVTVTAPAAPVPKSQPKGAPAAGAQPAGGAGTDGAAATGGPSARAPS